MKTAASIQDGGANNLGVGQQDFDVFMDTLIQENPDVPFCEGDLLQDYTANSWNCENGR